LLLFDHFVIYFLGVYDEEKTYIFWIKHYIFFHIKQHTIDLGKKEMEKFLTFLVTKKKVSPSTQNQAFSALLFLYREVFRSC